MRIIGLCGKTGSGKDAAAEHLSKTYGEGVPPFKASGVLRRMLRLSGKPEIPERFSALFEAVAVHLGKQWVAAEMVDRIRVDHAARGIRFAVVVGIRNLDEVALYRREFGTDFLLVAIQAPQSLRFGRVRNRGERPNEHDMPMQEFVAIEALCSCTEEDAVIEVADVRVANEGTLEELYAKLDRICRP